MNVRNPRKRVPTAKGRQNKNISNLPAEPLSGSNSIPKQHVGTDQTNQLQFDQETDRVFSPIGRQIYFDEEDDFNIPFKTYIRIDEDPFEFLTEDLFDNSFSENREQTQSESNKKVPLFTTTEALSMNEEIPSIKKQNEEQSKEQTEKQVAKQIESEYEGRPLQNKNNMPKRKRRNIYLKEKVKNHPLGAILQKWIEQEWSTEKPHPSYKGPISKFIEFLVDQKVQVPTREHIVAYYVKLRKDPKVKKPDFHMSAIRVFFKWADSASLYENVTEGTRYQLAKRVIYTEPKPQNANRGQEIPNLNNKVQNKTYVSKVIITMRDMINAQFLPIQAEYLMNNDLVVFKRWIKTLDDSGTNNQKKGRILKFAYFLHSENRTTPTQKDIIDYYKKELSYLSVDTANKSMLSIRNFFSWTAEQTIYPNIAINTYTANRKPINEDDIPILVDEICMQSIPNPTKPLINKTI